MRKLGLIIFSILFFSTPVFAVNTYLSDFKEQSIHVSKTDVINNAMQIQFDPDSSAPDYIGFAKAGRATSDDAWLIYKYVYSGSAVVYRKVAYGIWDNRASLTYS